MIDTTNWPLMLVLCVFLVIAIGQFLATIRNSKHLQENLANLNRIREENKQQSNPIEESESLLTFARTFVSQIAILKFAEFRDSHDMTKVTRANVSGLVQEIATTVEDALNFENINFNRLLFSDKFFDQYIVNYTVDVVKRLTDQEVNHIADAGQVSE